MIFLTSNEGKLREIRAVISDVQHRDTDLIEIQELDAHAIIKAKLGQAQQLYPNEQLIVEDTSLYIHAMKELPGPLIKWFLKTVGVEGIYTIASAFQDMTATARTIIGYANPEQNDIQFFEGTVEGMIVLPRGEQGFGWDKLFQPAGQSKTFAEMSQEEKNECSMRQKAAQELLKSLSSKRDR